MPDRTITLESSIKMRITSRLVSFVSRRTAWSEGHVFTIAPEQMNVADGLRTAAGMALAIGAAIYFNIHDLAFAAVAVFWTFLVDPLGETKQRLKTLLQFTLLGTAAITLGVFGAHMGTLTAGLTLFALVFACGMTRSYNVAFGPTPAQGGLIAAVAVVIGISSPRDLTGTVYLGVYFAAGCLGAIALALPVWPRRSPSPGRQMLIAIFSRLEQMLSSLLDLDTATNANPERWNQFNIVYRRATRISIERGRAIVARMVVKQSRYSRAIDAAGRAFAALIALGHYRNQEGRPFNATERSLILDLRDSLRLVIEQIDGKHLSPPVAPQDLLELVARAGKEIGLVGRSVRFAAQALENFLRSWEDPEPNQIPPLVAANQPPNKISSIVWRHSLRVALAVLCCYLIGVSFDVSFSYWGAITTLVVMQPIVGNTWLRVLERAVGSFIGGSIAAFLIWQLSGVVEMAIVIVLLSAVVIALRLVNYGLFVICLTPMFMLLSDYLRPSDGLILARVINESLGACLGLVASIALWPDREIRSLSGLIASAIQANLAFATAVLRSKGDETADLDQLQQGAGVASARLETARERLWLEGRKRSQRLQQLGSVTAALRAVCGAAAVLEITGLQEPDDARAAMYEQISTDVQQWLASPKAIDPPNIAIAEQDDLERSLEGLIRALADYVGTASSESTASPRLAVHA
ncbi:FUSC family protein [Rhizobium sp. AG207R]|uniref:FUSC family protein n=1 Tax=Rhizobium sp. AG207R TaxID=2802287 RepID=UPI0022ABD518|nr:FUSC family protein [Rhizobium sp. AG207R]MCZ3380553.1 FUSC family protein [Rhizobium sp. AG207R]